MYLVLLMLENHFGVSRFTCDRNSEHIVFYTKGGNCIVTYDTSTGVITFVNDAVKVSKEFVEDLGVDRAAEYIKEKFDRKPAN